MNSFWTGFEKRAESEDDMRAILNARAIQPKQRPVARFVIPTLLGAMASTGMVGDPAPGLLLGGGIGAIKALRGMHHNAKRQHARELLLMPEGPEKSSRIMAEMPKSKELERARFGA